MSEELRSELVKQGKLVVSAVEQFVRLAAEYGLTLLDIVKLLAVFSGKGISNGMKPDENDALEQARRQFEDQLGCN